jgi:hypothetical protein
MEVVGLNASGVDFKRGGALVRVGNGCEDRVTALGNRLLEPKWRRLYGFPAGSYAAEARAEVIVRHDLTATGVEHPHRQVVREPRLPEPESFHSWWHSLATF